MPGTTETAAATVSIEAIVDQTPAIMYVAAPAAARLLRRVSPAFAQTLGYASRDEVALDSVWRRHLHPRDQNRVFGECARALAGEGRLVSEYRVIDCSGRERWFHDEMTVVRNPNGAPMLLHGFIVDITESRAIEARLRNYTHDLGERVKELDCLYSISYLSEEGSIEAILERVVQILPAAWQYPGRAYARIEFEGRTFATRNYAYSRWQQTADVVVDGETVGRVVVGYLDSDGEDDVSPFLEEERALIEAIARRLADVIVRRRAEEALRRSEGLYRTLAKNIPNVAVALFDRELRCTLAEGAAGRLISKESAEGRPLQDLWAEAGFAWILRNCQEALRGTERIEEVQHDGASLVVHTLPVMGADGQAHAGMIVVQDITERRSLEKEVLEISAREQRRVGQDLHDGLGQLLTGVACLSSGLAKRLEERQLAEAREAAEITELVRHATTEARFLARGLMPVELDARGLVSALHELAYDTENFFNVACIFRCEAPVLIEDSTAATHLYRITQEATNNAIKHGQASRIVIRLMAENGQAVLAIADDGCGFRVDPDRPAGMGLRIMKYRAQMIGGSLEIRANSPQGTVVTCRFPYPGQQA